MVGVLPHRDGATRTTSAFSSARRLAPSSCSMAYSTAAMRALYRCTSPTPCSREATRRPGRPSRASTRRRCRSKKSITSARVRCSSVRISSTAAVVNTSGVTPEAITASITATTRRASPTVVMKGKSRRSKATSGNWMSSALPIVSALMPVESERKNTGTAGSAAGAPP